MGNNHYQKNKGKLSKKAREWYQNLCKEEKMRNRQIACEPYGSLSEDEK